MRHVLHLATVLGFLGSSTGCAAGNDDAGTEASPDRSSSCRRPEGTTGSPQTILEVIDLVNHLPRPVTLPCLVESLDRPLSLNATTSVDSLQPAEGERSPRIFLMLGRLSLSLVPDGPNRELLELGQASADGYSSIKAEIAFPIAGELEPSEPFRRLLLEDRQSTRCFGICHYPETPVPDYVAGAFESGTLRPRPSQDVRVGSARAQHEQCDPRAEPERCRLYNAIFGHGEVQQGEFPATMPTFLGQP